VLDIAAEELNFNTEIQANIQKSETVRSIGEMGSSSGKTSWIVGRIDHSLNGRKWGEYVTV